MSTTPEEPPKPEPSDAVARDRARSLLASMSDTDPAVARIYAAHHGVFLKAPEPTVEDYLACLDQLSGRVCLRFDAEDDTRWLFQDRRGRIWLCDPDGRDDVATVDEAQDAYQTAASVAVRPASSYLGSPERGWS